MNCRNRKLLTIVSLLIFLQAIVVSIVPERACSQGPEEPSPPPEPATTAPSMAPSHEPIVPDTTYGTGLHPSNPDQMPAPNAPLQGYADMYMNAAPPVPPPTINPPILNGNISTTGMAPVPTNQPIGPPLEKQEPKPGLFAGALRNLLAGSIKKNVGPAQRPWWIPGNATTNDAMVAPYHNMDIFWWDKKPMPDRPQWVRLSTSVSRYWRGFVSEPCFIYIQPTPQAPGNFVFSGRQPNGPRGWLQALNEHDAMGFPQYRYWLDQP